MDPNFRDLQNVVVGYIQNVNNAKVTNPKFFFVQVWVKLIISKICNPIFNNLEFLLDHDDKH